ncbi:hypothetical protein HMPREF0864_04840, partial [Enterobacteriaceae bacterium 9_2_54FAA]
KVGFILPMAASNVRARQPVTEVAQALAQLAGVPCFDDLLLKAPGGVSLKNLNTKQEKVDAIGGSFSINPVISNEGKCIRRQLLLPGHVFNVLMLHQT